MKHDLLKSSWQKESFRASSLEILRGEKDSKIILKTVDFQELTVWSTLGFQIGRSKIES